jgi:hypothetical protein
MEQRNSEAVRNAALLKAKQADNHYKAVSLAAGTQSANSSATNSTTTEPQTSTPKSTVTTTKYATSPDPRSTTYSTTPPAPNPASFTTSITHNGQVVAGTLIGYNATKNLKTYYGGDLQFSSTTATVSEHMNSVTSAFTIKTPDGAQAGMPTMPWNDQSSIAFPATNGFAGLGNSWTMFLQLEGTPTPSVTPYLIHLQTFRLGGGDVEWEYDGFVSLYVDY